MLKLFKRGSYFKEYNKQYDYISFYYYQYHTLFFKSLIFRGRKLWAFKFFQNLKYELKLRENVDPFWIFLTAIMKITPDLVLFPLRLGGRIQSVPMPIGFKKQFSFAVKWVIKLLKDKYRRISVKLIADCLVSALSDQGYAIEKKKSIYALGCTNRHFIRFFK